jgi:hypothetical protein
VTLRETGAAAYFTDVVGCTRGSRASSRATGALEPADAKLREQKTNESPVHYPVLEDIIAD